MRECEGMGMYWLQLKDTAARDRDTLGHAESFHTQKW